MALKPVPRTTIRAWMDKCMEIALDPACNVDGMMGTPSDIYEATQAVRMVRDYIRREHDIVIEAPLHTTFNEDAMAVYIVLLELYPEG